MSGSLEGIGAALRERDDLIEVSELVPGGAASRQGKLAPGDLILSVQQPEKDAVDIMDMRLDKTLPSYWVRRDPPGPADDSFKEPY
jgi:carboxyl-terminal processing protease